MEKLDDVLTRLGEKIQARSEQEAGLTKPKIVSGAHRPSALLTSKHQPQYETSINSAKHPSLRGLRPYRLKPKPPRRRPGAAKK